MSEKVKLGCVVVVSALLYGCGGGSSDPADMYVGSWRSACYSYMGQDRNTYFQRRTLSLSKLSATSLSGISTDAIAHSDSSCTRVLGPITNDDNVTIEIGPKANFLDSVVDTINLAYASASFPGYMTVSQTSLYIVISETPGVVPVRWGKASPFSRTEPVQAATARSHGNSVSDKRFAPQASGSPYSPL